VPAEQRLASAAVGCNGRLQREQCVDSSRRRQSSRQRRTGQCIVHVRCGTGLSDETRRQSSNGQNRQNSNGWVTWLAHRTLSGAPIDRQPPQRLNWWLGLYPPTTTTLGIQVFQTFHSIQELVQSIQDTIQKNQSLSKSQIHSKHLVTRERVLLVFFELLFLDRFLFPHSCSLSDL
jgi:hypothetical protein